MHQKNGIIYPMKFRSPTPCRFLKDHLRLTCLLNSVLIDHCFYSMNHGLVAALVFELQVN